MFTRAFPTAHRSTHRPLMWVVLASAGLAVASGLAGCDRQAPASPTSTQPKSGASSSGSPTGTSTQDQSKTKQTEQAASSLPIEEVQISGKTFKLERADNDTSRVKGLSGRTDIPADGGMIFVFAESRRLNFVMRDCPIGIDIIFLDPSGRVVAQHKMKPEEPRRPGEDDQTYERRLRLYPSQYGAQFAIEFKEGTLDQLKLKNGDQIKLDLERLKHAAK